MANDGSTPWARFTPGPAVGIIGPRTACLVLDQPDSELVRGLSTAIERDAPVDELLDGMVRVAGLSLPPFGIVAVEGRQLRVVVRGDVSVLLDPDGDDGGVEVTVGRLLTWCEHVGDDVDTARIQLGSASQAPTRFETSLGVIPAERLDLVIADAPAADVPATATDDGDGSPEPEAVVPEAVLPGGARSDSGDAEDGSTDALLVIRDRGDLEVPADPQDPDPARDRGSADPGEDDGPADSGLDLDADLDSGADGAGPVGSDASDSGEADSHDSGEGVPVPPMFTPSRPGAVPTTFEARSEPVSLPTAVDAADGEASSPADAVRSPAHERDTLIGPFDLHPDEHADQATIAPHLHEPAAASGPGTAGTAAAGSPGLDQQPGSAPLPGSDVDDYDHLFGATQFRTVEEAAVRPLEDHDDDHGGGAVPMIGAVPGGLDMPPPTGAPVLPGEEGGDHDGHTISLAALRATGGGPVPAGTAAMPGISPPVHAVRCPNGHLNPPHAGSCRSCGATIEDQEHVTVPRPVLGRLEFADGRVVEVSRPLLIGRAPRAEGALGGEPPELVAVPSPSKEVSGTHVEIRLEGWQVLVVDRHSTNGTVIVLPGRDPMRLRPGEPFPITPGTSVSLADEVELTFEASA